MTLSDYSLSLYGIAISFEFIGFVVLDLPNPHNVSPDQNVDGAAVLGYMLGKQFWGQGYGSGWSWEDGEGRRWADDLQCVEL
jgi:RimJ/RimL family protein N-acetyltransferase